MTSVGVMASSVTLPSAVDVLLEPFNDFTTNGWVPGAGTIVAARTGTGARFASTAGIVGKWAIPTPSQSAYATIGFAFRANALPAGAITTVKLMSNGGTTNEVGINLTSAGAVQIVHGSAVVLATSATAVVTAATYYYVELTAYNHDTDGYATVRVNGVQVASVTGVDTKNGGVLYDGIGLCGASSGNANIFDDLYLTMGAGAAFKGSITIP